MVKIKRSKLSRIKSLVKKPCPSGKIRNLKTGYCRKSKSRNLRKNNSSIKVKLKEFSKNKTPFKVGTNNVSLSSCLASKKRLQKSVLRLASKLLARKNANSKSKTKPRSVTIRKTSTRTNSLASSKTRIKSLSRRKTKTRTHNRSRTRSHSGSLMKQLEKAGKDLLKRQEILLKRQEKRAAQEDDFLMHLAKKYGEKKGKQQFTDKEIQQVIKKAEQNMHKAGPAKPAAKAKKRMAPTFLGTK